MILTFKNYLVIASSQLNKTPISLKENECSCPSKASYENIHSNITHNDPKLEIPQMPVIVEQIINCGILEMEYYEAVKKEQNIETCKKMDGSHRYQVL